MALLATPLNIQRGKIGNMSFYKDRHGRTHIREIQERKKIQMSDYEETPWVRNNMEFRDITRASRLIRQGLCYDLDYMRDSEHHNRLTGLLKHVANTDFDAVYGFRDSFRGNLNLLIGYEFNENNRLRNAFKGNFETSIDPETGKMVVELDAFIPAVDIAAPKGATQCQLIIQGTTVSRSNQLKAQQYTDCFNLNSTEARAPQRLELELKPQPGQVMVLAVGVLYYEEFLGIPLMLRGGAQMIADISVANMPVAEGEVPAKALTLAEYYEKLDDRLQYRYRPNLPNYDSRKTPNLFKEQLRLMRRELYKRELDCLRKGLYGPEGREFKALMKRLIK